MARTSAVGFCILNKAYIGTGEDSTGNFLKDFWEYDPATDSWTQLADFIGTSRTGAVGFGIDSSGYLGLGRDSISFLKDLWKYNPFINSWSREQDLGQYRSTSSNGRKDAAVTVLSGSAYIIGGYDGTSSYVKQCWRFDPLADTSWTLRRNFANATDFTVIGRRWGVAFSANSSVYFGTGYDYLHDYQKDLWKYNISTDSWSQVADLPGKTRSNATAFNLFGKGYILCGSNGEQQHDMWRYDPLINNWSRMADYPGAVTLNNTSFAISNRAFVGLGNDSNNVCKSDLWEYIPDSTTGISDLRNSFQFEVFPNPANEYLVIRSMVSTLKFPFSFQLYSLEGRLILQKIILENNLRIQREKFTSGIYYFSITKDNQSLQTGKIIFY